MRRRILIGLVTLTLVLSLVACGDNKKTNDEDQQLLIGMEAAYPPFNWTQKDDSNGAIPIQNSPEFANGYDVQIAKKIAQKLGKEPLAVKTEWDGLEMALSSGKVDLVIAGMSPTSERAKRVDFSQPYYNSDLVLVVAEGSLFEDAKSLADFDGANVVAQLNTFHDTVVEQIPNVNHMTPMADFSTIRVAVQTGRADAYVAERPEAMSAEAAGVGLKMVSLEEGFQTIEEDTAVAVAVKKGSSELLSQINEAINQISEEDRVSIMDQMIELIGE